MKIINKYLNFLWFELQWYLRINWLYESTSDLYLDNECFVFEEIYYHIKTGRRRARVININHFTQDYWYELTNKEVKSEN